MSKKTVAFVEPAGSESNVFEDYMRLPLMGPFHLGTILHDAGHDVRIYSENVLGQRIDPFRVQADVYCITSLTLNADRARLLAHQIKQIHRDSRVIIGGIHASLLPANFVDVADHVVCGEAERIIVDLVEGRVGEQIVAGAPVEDLDSLPPVNYGLLEQSHRLGVIPIMTSRGCPFDCDFCTVTKIFGRRFRVQSPERVLDELNRAVRYFGRRFFFYDDNFTANRDRIGSLCGLIARAGLRIHWTAQVRADLARDPELVEEMERVGCRRVFIGFESIRRNRSRRR
ncbi:MAG: radical SAM protein [Planctomycetota bacterium]